MKICIVLNVFTDEFVQNLTQNGLLLLTGLCILICCSVLYFGFRSQWFAKLFGSARSVTQSRIALQDYQRNVEANFLKSPLPLNEALNENNGAVTPATIIERAIQSQRKFSDRSIKNWRELYEADIHLVEKTLQSVVKSEILLRLSQYANDGTSIIDCMKSVNELWRLVTKGVIVENGQTIILFPDEKPGYGVSFSMEPDRPIISIGEDFTQHVSFEEFLKKLKHQVSDPDMSMSKIENILKESNMADTPIIFRGARQILADRWMELFDVSMKEIDMSTISHETLWDMYQDVVKMKTTVDVYPELVDISSNLEIQKNNLTELWRVKYSAYWYKRLVDIDRYNDNEVLGSLSQATEQILVDEKKYLFNKNVFSETFIDCLKLAFEISEKSDNYQFLKKVQDWFEEHDSVDRFGYKAKLQERFDSFVQNVPVPARNKLKAVKQA